jgi:eukaryotic-like serine/threonine-protein kinase
MRPDEGSSAGRKPPFQWCRPMTTLNHGTPRRRRVLRRTGWAVVLALLVVLPAGSSVAVGKSAPSMPATPPVGGGLSDPAGPGVGKDSKTLSAVSSAYDWPEFHLNPQLTGYASNSPLSTATASGLGVSWATDLYGAILDSPVVAYDSTLGRTLAYVGTENGDVVAVDIATGQTVWGTWLGSPIRSTPLLGDGSVFVGTFTNPAVFKLDASTGAVDCSVVSPQPLEGTPTLATPPGGVATVYVGSEDSVTRSGPILAINAATCALEWEFTGYAETAGSWDAVAYGLNATGTPLIVFGTSDPDSKVYAVNALTGVEIWQFQTYDPSPGDFDVGAGAAISPPGANGFPDGVAYVPNKYGIMYALDLTTGASIWSVNFNQIAGATEGGRSTAALDGSDLVFGYNGGLFDLNAVTGSVIWQYKDPSKTEALASPAIAGASGQEIAAVGDVAGGVDVVSLASGAQLYHYQTGGYIAASPAISNGNLLVASSDSFLYDFTVGGGNDAVLPSTTFTSPSDGSTLSNPNGALTLTGTASDPTAVTGVVVAIQSNSTNGPWWDGATSRWSPGPIGNPAALASPGSPSSTWSFAYPVPSGGGTYRATAYATSSSGQSDIKAAHVGYAVLFSTKGPHIKATPAAVGPGANVTVTGSGFGKSETVTISLAGTALGSALTTSKGNIASTKVKIPTNSTFGETSLTATGKTSGKAATVALTIENSWKQLGYDPGHTGFEPNDPILNLLITPGGHRWVDLAWHFEAGAPINASPAVANGVAYVSNAAGELFAIDVHNGGLIWTWSLPSGQAINGSAAVDPTRGLVFVGAADGTVDAVSTSTGLLGWSTSVGGVVSAPVYGGGSVYVTTSTGHVESLGETTGALTWAVSLASSRPSAPSLDSLSKLLVVGESNGDVVALSTNKGTTVWTFATGGAVTAAPTVSSGTVYVGSSDHSVYALSEATGKKVWSYATGGLVADTGALTHVGTQGGILDLLIGSGDGNLYELQAANGALNYLVNFHSPIVGVSATKGVVIIETASGLLGASRTYTSLDIWQYETAAGLDTSPAIVDGAIFIGADDGNLYAFTSYGQAPE